LPDWAFWLLWGEVWGKYFELFDPVFGLVDVALDVGQLVALDVGDAFQLLPFQELLVGENFLVPRDQVAVFGLQAKVERVDLACVFPLFRVFYQCVDRVEDLVSARLGVLALQRSVTLVQQIDASVIAVLAELKVSRYILRYLGLVVLELLGGVKGHVAESWRL
jgi:hypothetical protein